MQTNHDRPLIDTRRMVNNVGSLLAGDFSSAIASKLASYNCMVSAEKNTPNLTQRFSADFADGRG